MAIREAKESKRFIDLRGPDGNAFAILGTALDFSRQLGHSKEKTEAIQDEMKASDYEHLINTFDKHYGELVDLVR